MFILHADKNKLTVRRRELVTSGSVNVCQVRFEFSEDWDGMERVAVFRAGGESRSMLLDESGQCGIPWEVLAVHGRQLTAGVYGTRGDDVVLPTVWAAMGTVLEGAKPGGDACPPTPGLWEQALVGKADRLDYTENGKLGLYAGDELLSSVTVAGGDGAAWGIGRGLKVVGGELTVNAVSSFDGDNTLPMTAAGVQAAVGNIEALLGTI